MRLGARRDFHWMGDFLECVGQHNPLITMALRSGEVSLEAGEGRDYFSLVFLQHVRRGLEKMGLLAMCLSPLASPERDNSRSCTHSVTALL